MKRSMMMIACALGMSALVGCENASHDGQNEETSQFESAVAQYSKDVSSEETENTESEETSDEGIENSRHPRPPHPNIFNVLLKRLQYVYDSDDDKTLSEEEKSAGIAGLEQMRQLRVEELEGFDADGDDILSDSEKENLKAFFDEERQDIENRLDINQDGALDESEKTPHLVAIAITDKIVEEFLDYFDSDGDGRISPEESDVSSNADTEVTSTED